MIRTPSSIHRTRFPSCRCRRRRSSWSRCLRTHGRIRSIGADEPTDTTEMIKSFRKWRQVKVEALYDIFHGTFWKDATPKLIMRMQYQNRAESRNYQKRHELPRWFTKLLEYLIMPDDPLGILTPKRQKNDMPGMHQVTFFFCKRHNKHCSENSFSVFYNSFKQV